MRADMPNTRKCWVPANDGRMAVVWPLALALLTPLILLAGLAAIVGIAAIGVTAQVRRHSPARHRPPLAPVLPLESSPADLQLSRAA